MSSSFARPRLFDASMLIMSKVTMIVYRFDRQGIHLSIAGTRHRPGRKHLQPSGVPSYVGSWPYTISSPHSFDQGSVDPWAELGEVEGEGEEEGEAE